ncbi:MAG: calcium-binding protein, partial [Nocardioides sp.]
SPAQSAAAADATCAGQEATLVGDGTWDHEIIGTDGVDVIVSNGARLVDAAGGDDVVCLTGASSIRFSVRVVDGAGDDLIRNETAFEPGDRDGINDAVSVILTDGDDTYVGGAGPERVSAAGGADDITTAGGSDYVSAGSASTSLSEDPFDGRVDLGAEGGTLAVGPRVDPSTIMLGGTGPSKLIVSDSVAGTTGWVVDAPLGLITLEEETRFQFTDFTEFVLLGKRVERFVGTPEADLLSAADLVLGIFGDGDDQVFASTVETAIMGAGDDTTRLRGATATSGDLDGGPGDDLLWAIADAGLAVDLVEETLTYSADASTRDFSGFETYDLAAEDLKFNGTPGPDDAHLQGCRLRASSRGGDDRISLVPGNFEDGVIVCTQGSPSGFRFAAGAGDDVVNSRSTKGTITGNSGDDRITGAGSLSGGPGDDRIHINQRYTRAIGGRGNDLLVGFRFADLLLGGVGHDRALGRGGQDRCVAEVQRSCER